MLCVHLPRPSAGMNTVSMMDLLLVHLERQGAGVADHGIKILLLVIVVDHSRWSLVKYNSCPFCLEKYFIIPQYSVDL